MSALRGLVLQAAGALRGAAQQQAGWMMAAAAGAASRGVAGSTAAASAAAAQRLFSSSSSIYSSSIAASAMGAAGLRQLALCGSSSGVAAACRLAGSSGSSSLAAAPACRPGSWALQQARGRNNSAHLVPKFKGGKMKSYSSYKSRFKITGTGKVMYDRPGHVHKRFNKTKSQLFRLSGLRVMQKTYAKTVRKLGFKTRTLS